MKNNKATEKECNSNRYLRITKSLNKKEWNVSEKNKIGKRIHIMYVREAENKMIVLKKLIFKNAFPPSQLDASSINILDQEMQRH